jgi:hypothetical protein
MYGASRYSFELVSLFLRVCWCLVSWILRYLGRCWYSSRLILEVFLHSSIGSDGFPSLPINVAGLMASLKACMFLGWGCFPGLSFHHFIPKIPLSEFVAVLYIPFHSVWWRHLGIRLGILGIATFGQFCHRYCYDLSSQYF